MGDRIAAIFGTLGIAVVATSLLLPGRQTPAFVTAVFNGYSNAARASEGLPR